MRFNSLNDWLTWQEGLHPKTIDLGLDRVREVLERLGLHNLSSTVITVAGTNGKGSSVALLESILRSAGYCVGAYTSPHLVRYNERIRIAGNEVTDQDLVQAFDKVDQARQDISLTYFEFGTLAAIELFSSAELDVVILEVGLGGRLDAVNIIDPDIALVTTVDIDHENWLGHDRESIAREKGGIFRAKRPAVYGDIDIPGSLSDCAKKLDLPIYRLGQEFSYSVNGISWSWESGSRHRHALPYPCLRGAAQVKNAAATLMVLELLDSRLPVSQNDIRQGLLEVNISARFQLIPGDITQVLDVAHNPQAAGVLVDNLQSLPCTGRTHALVAMLADKNIKSVLKTMDRVVDVWHLAGLSSERGASSEILLQNIPGAVGQSSSYVYANVVSAYHSALNMMKTGDRLVVFGSFYMVAEVLQQQAATVANPRQQDRLNVR